MALFNWIKCECNAIFLDSLIPTYAWSKKGLYGDPFGMAMPNPEGKNPSGISSAWHWAAGT